MILEERYGERKMPVSDWGIKMGRRYDIKIDLSAQPALFLGVAS